MNTNTARVLHSLGAIDFTNDREEAVRLRQTFISKDKESPGTFRRLLIAMLADNYGATDEYALLSLVYLYHESAIENVENGALLWLQLGIAFGRIPDTDVRIGFLGPNYSFLSHGRARSPEGVMSAAYEQLLQRAQRLPDGEREEAFGYAHFNRANQMLRSGNYSVADILPYIHRAAEQRTLFSRYLEATGAPDEQIFAAWQQVAKLHILFANDKRFSNLKPSDSGVSDEMYQQLVARYGDRLKADA